MDKSALASAEPVGSETEDPQTRDLRVALEAQSRYMSFLSHDLRGSLNGLVLMVEVLKREIEGQSGSKDEVLADLAMMKRALVDTVGMMERHVVADRLRRGKANVVRQPVKLAEVVGEAMGKVGSNSRMKPSIAVEVPDDAVVNADRELLRMAVVEVLDNLGKHCGECHARVSARKEGGNWLLEVSDDGPGMPAEVLDQWMDPVKRGQIQERGIGLSLVQLVAKAMGGRVEGASEEGKGMRLRLWVPAASAGT
jgi:signal transduction histidine kinase